MITGGIVTGRRGKTSNNPPTGQSRLVSTNGPIQPVDSGGLIDPARLFAPDPLPAHAYRDTLRRERVPEGVRRMLLAMVEDAVVTCLLKHAERAATDSPDYQFGGWRADYIEARRWVMMPTEPDPKRPERTWIFSFEHVCEQLEIDASAIRAHVERHCPPIKPYLQAVPRLAGRPPVLARSGRKLKLMDRAWVWMCEQTAPWSKWSLERAMGANHHQTAGIVGVLVREGRLRRVRVEKSRTTVGWYEVVRDAAAAEGA